MTKKTEYEVIAIWKNGASTRNRFIKKHDMIAEKKLIETIPRIVGYKVNRLKIEVVEIESKKFKRENGKLPRKN